MKDKKLYQFLRPLVRIIMKLFYRVEIVNKDYVIDNDRIVLCGNHTNYLDCLLIASSIKRNVYFMAKNSLNKGLKKHLFKNLGIIPIDRSNKNPEALSKAEELLQNKKIVCIFPEGTINRTDKIIIPFKFGAVSLANKSKSYLVAFAITGKYRLFKKSVKIEFMKPYKVSDNLVKENNILMDKVKNLIIKNGGIQ